MAEASLMSLLEAMLSLAARPALLRRPVIDIKPGGYPDDIFLELTEEKKEEIQCAICYQVMKEVMECQNKHKFCFSCIQVWSTSGEYLNRILCPVCRCDGHYTRNSDLDCKIVMNRVKCSMQGCNWNGMLKYQGTHRHSNYQSTSSSNTSSLPPLKNDTVRPSESRSTIPSLSSLQSLSLTPSMSHAYNNSLSSPVDNGSLTLSAEINNNSVFDSVPTSPIIPVPPRTPRPSFIPRRRVPTLPSIVNNINPIPPAVAPASTSVSQPGTSLLSRRRASQSLNSIRTQSQRSPENLTTVQSNREITTAIQSSRDNLTTVRDRLAESRNRIEGLRSTFNDDANNEVEIFSFQEERINNRQQQLHEVQELGRRLGQVAAELRQLLEHRTMTSHDNDSDD